MSDQERITDIDSVDFFRDQTLLTDPYPFWTALHDASPVRRETHHNVVMVTGYEEAVSVLGDSETYSSCTSVTGPFPGFPVPLEGRDDVADLIAEHRDKLPMSDQLPTLDPPVHTNHRSLLLQLITPKRLKENEDAMWDLADFQFERYLQGGKGEFIGEFAGPFTLLVIADLLGVPEEDRDDFAEHMAGGHGDKREMAIGSTGEGKLELNPLEYLYKRFSEYIEDRRAAPRDDVLTGLAKATFPDGSTPDVLDVVRVASNLYSAGQETTVRLLSAALQILAERPDVQQLLRAERDRIPNFIEETLRFESPVKGDFRLSKVPTTIGGVDVPSGTTVMLLNGAANHDPRQFENPTEFDVTRKNARRHIAFGRGIHSCPGAPLARAEAKVAIERFLDHTTDIRIDESVHGPQGNRRFNYVPTYILRGLTKLHLEFDLKDPS